MLSVITMTVAYAQCHNKVIILSIVTLSVIIQDAVMLSFEMLGPVL